MSVRDRIDESKLLFQAGRLEGALILILLAVAGTSRKRYPRALGKNDREAFEQFLRDERPKITGGNELQIHFKGKLHTLEFVLYTFVRNSLLHEAALDDHVSFEYGDFLLDKRGTTDYFTFSSELAIRLAYAVESAPENKALFPDGRYDRLPEPNDLTQIAIIKYQWGDQNFEAFCSACSIQREVWEESGEEITWLHMKARQAFNGQVTEGPGVRILVPAMYVLSVEHGPRFQRTRKRTSADVGVFPPSKPAPTNAMDLVDVEANIAELQIPLVATTITIRRPHY